MNPSRSYQLPELVLLNSRELRALVDKQPDRWPKDVRLNSKTVKRTFRKALLDPRNGFTTDEPLAMDDFAGGADLDGALDSASASLTDNILALHPGSTTGFSSMRPCLDGPHRRSLHLYVEDNRTRSKSSVTIGALVSDRIACASGEWRVEASHVLEELQKTTAQISGRGLVKVGVPDVTSPDFTTYFVQSTVKKLMTAPTNPTHLVVPASNWACLTLRVEHVTGISALKLACEDLPSDDEESPASRVQFPKGFRPLEAARSRARIHQCLSTLVRLRPEYQSFIETRHAVLQNSDILSIWRFISAFKEEYYGKDISEISDNADPGARVTKASIRIALGLGETCFKEAEEGARLVGSYGTGGIYEAAEVVEELEAKRDPPGGKGRLLRFLHAWEAAHPTPLAAN